MVDVFLQAKRDGAAVTTRLLRSHGGEPRKIVTDKLRSYGVAHRELMPDVIHDNSQYANNRTDTMWNTTRKGGVGRSQIADQPDVLDALDAGYTPQGLAVAERRRVRRVV